jgi:hypothetical protein
VKIRQRAEVVDRCRGLAVELRAALSRLPQDEHDPDVIEAVWRGEGLGTLLWALHRADMPPYDQTFDHEWLVRIPFIEPQLRDSNEIARARETARLWHWRARTTFLEEDPGFELPPPWTSVQELVSSVATRGHEQGLLPEPVGDDFPALGFFYRWATPDERAELLSIAYERHRALNWLCTPGTDWDDVALDT